MDYCKPLILSATAAAALLAALGPSLAVQERDTPAAGSRACANGNGGITLPPGFCATVFADDIGHARHLVVAPNGVVYVNTWSGRYYGNTAPHAGGFLVALQDTTGDGRADVNVRFGPDAKSGNAGGTGIASYNGALYAETNDRIVRYTLPAGKIAPTAPPEVIVSGLPLTGDHPMHPFEIDAHGALYVDLGSATNSCQVAEPHARLPRHPAMHRARNAGRHLALRRQPHGAAVLPAERFVTGLRNGEGIAFDSAGRHLRDPARPRPARAELAEALYAGAGRDEPAEELVQLERGADYGWPYCYFDLSRQKLVLAPEYGGDGGKTIGVCAQKRAPIAAFPGHWAPNDLALYEGQQFPSAYRGGAFIAFHGSWNRAPFAQGGYNVVFQPLARREGFRAICGLRRRLCRRGRRARSALRTGHRVWRSARTVRSTSRTTSAGASGASATKVL